MGLAERALLRPPPAVHITCARPYRRDDRHFGANSGAGAVLALARRHQVSGLLFIKAVQLPQPQAYDRNADPALERRDDAQVAQLAPAPPVTVERRPLAQHAEARVPGAELAASL